MITVFQMASLKRKRRPPTPALGGSTSIYRREVIIKFVCTNSGPSTHQPSTASLMQNINNLPSSIRSLARPIDAQIAITGETKVLEQEATFEVLVGVENGIELARIPQVFVFDLFENVSIDCGANKRGSRYIPF